MHEKKYTKKIQRHPAGFAPTKMQKHPAGFATAKIHPKGFVLLKNIYPYRGP